MKQAVVWKTTMATEGQKMFASRTMRHRHTMNYSGGRGDAIEFAVILTLQVHLELVCTGTSSRDPLKGVALDLP